MRTPKKRKRAGFTLIELVAALALSGMALVFTAMLLTISTSIYISSSHTMEDSQKFQVALNRLVKELTFAAAGTVEASSAGALQWTSSHPDRLAESMVATWDGASGSELYLQGVPLVDNVGSFSVSIAADSITVALEASRSPGLQYSSTIHPRYEL